MATLHPSNPYYHAWNRHLDEEAETILSPYEPKKAQRSASVDTPAPPLQPPQPKGSNGTVQRPRNPQTVSYRTRSIGGPFCAGVYFEREIDLSPPNDDEIIIATVRVTNSFRRASVEGCDELPSRCFATTKSSIRQPPILTSSQTTTTFLHPPPLLPPLRLHRRQPLHRDENAPTGL